jgi:hypothetical protein
VEGGITGDKQFRGNMKSKVSQTISEILDLKKEMYAQTGNLDRMQSKLIERVSSIELMVNNMLVEIGGTVIEIKEGLDRLNEEFFTTVFQTAFRPYMDKIEADNKAVQGMLI